MRFNDWEADFIVRLSGCPADCASRYHFLSRPGATIAGRTFAAVTAEEHELADLAIAAATAHFGAPMTLDTLR